MINKIISIILSITFSIPVSWGKSPVDVSEVLNTRKCGDFKLLSETVQEIENLAHDSYACRVDDGINDVRHKTKGAVTELHVRNEVLETAKNVGDVVDRVLLDLIREKINYKFNQKLKTLDLQQDKSFEQVYRSMQKKILDDGKSAKSQVRKLLVLFPEVEDEILKENPEYKALICRHEVWKKNRKILRAVALGLTLVELTALLAAAPIAATIVITANIDRALLLSQILMVGGVAGVLAGALQVENSIANWDNVTAAKNAKMLLKFYNDVEDEIKKLQKNATANEAKIRELKKWLPTTPEREQLKLTKKKEFAEYKNLFFGLTKVGAGVAMIYGGDQLLQMINQFEAESVVDPSGGSISPPWMN
jgi:hypothetical protein